MAKPARNAHPEDIARPSRTFFATTKTHAGRRLLQSDRNATLLIGILRCCVAERKFQPHDFVIMPDHIHLLITVGGSMSIERAMQFVKGRFSYRLKKELGYLGEVWQPGFSEMRADTEEIVAKYRQYIEQNPIKAGLAEKAGQYPYCYRHLAMKKTLRG